MERSKTGKRENPNDELESTVAPWKELAELSSSQADLTMQQIFFTARQRAELKPGDDHDRSPDPHEIGGRTLVSLISPGTELNWGFLGEEFPAETGYACIFEVDEIGSEVTDLTPGALVFASGPHAERQRAPRDSVTPLPDGLAAEVAVFARLMGVSMSTLNTTAAHPPARVLITGLGPVGNLAAQVFSRCGYRVTAVDPVLARRDTAAAVGLSDVRSSTADGPDELTDKIALHVDCSGHEQAVLDGCRCVAKRGEVVLLGTPWAQRTNLLAFELLETIFFRYVVVRSGWEWEVPEQPREFAFNSMAGNYAAALEWLRDGSVKVDGLATTFSPADAQDAYAGLLDGTLDTPGALFDWRLLPTAPRPT